MSDSADNVEKNEVDTSENRSQNGSPDTVIATNKEAKNFFKKLLNAPCGGSPKIIQYGTITICGLLAWAMLFAILENEIKPGGQLFLLIVLTILSYFCGWVASLLYLPPLLGMLLCGIGLRNVGLFDVTGVYIKVVGTIREIALTVILLKAGLGLDAGALKKLSFVVARLAFTPCITETCAAAAAAHYLLNMPWMWGLLLGSCLSAVSPAIVVPTLLILKEKGYGESKGISTLVIAASSIDDIIAISAFSVILGMIFSEGGDLMHTIIQGPVEIVIGLVAGVVWGIVAACFPHRNEEYLIAKRSFMVGGGGLAAVLLSTHTGYSGSGPLAAIILSFLASLCWKWQGWSNTYNPVSNVFNGLWGVMQPLLFGLIGTEINFQHIEMSLIWFGIGVLVFGLFIRIVTCCIVLIGANLNLKEVIFVNLAWLPKATVQATLGPIALDTAIRNKMIEVQPFARDVLTIAVLSILITAPIGAIGISLGGPKLLSNEGFNKYRKNKSNKSDLAVIEDHM